MRHVVKKKQTIQCEPCCEAVWGSCCLLLQGRGPLSPFRAEEVSAWLMGSPFPALQNKVIGLCADLLTPQAFSLIWFTQLLWLCSFGKSRSVFCTCKHINRPVMLLTVQNADWSRNWSQV